MQEIYYLFFAFGVGLALGAFFSLSLWSSVKKMTEDRTPWYVLFGNFVLRISVVLIGFLLVMAGKWERMVAALLGFIVMREIIAYCLRRKTRYDKGVAWRS